MGVKKLWPFIAPLCELCDYFTAATGLTIGEDASSWLHALAAAKSGAPALDLLQPVPTFELILREFTTRLQRVLDAGIRPVFVFDGKRPGAKAGTDQSRSVARSAAAASALALLQAGDRVKASKHAIKAVRIPDELVYLIIHKILRPKGIGQRCPTFLLCILDVP
jgi:hypothetical protein